VHHLGSRRGNVLSRVAAEALQAILHQSWEVLRPPAQRGQVGIEGASVETEGNTLLFPCLNAMPMPERVARPGLPRRPGRPAAAGARLFPVVGKDLSDRPGSRPRGGRAAAAAGTFPARGGPRPPAAAAAAVQG